MKTVLKWLLRLVLIVAVLIAALVVLGPREPVDVSARFDPSAFGADLDAYFEGAEAPYDDIVEGTEKRVVWAGERGAVTPVSIVYLHGFSATSEEIRPVPDKLAAALGANLVYTRLAGHGRTGDALAAARVADWMTDAAEALAAGREVGERVIVVSTSTGGTLLAAASVRDDLMEKVVGAVFVSPNFQIKAKAARILTWPAVRWWGPVVAGAERAFEPSNELHRKYWTSRYPTVALIPMAALVHYVAGLDLSRAMLPALFIFSDDDQVVDAAKTRDVIARWGGETEVHAVTMGPDDDDGSHVIMGDILSPGQTENAVATMLAWANRILEK